jgi:arylsulfatase A-like enzyme
MIEIKKRVSYAGAFSVVLLLFCAALVFVIPACKKTPAPQNFILITLDTLRADYVSAYSRQNAATPNLDFLAGQGTLYKNAYCLIPITLPSHASIFFSEPPTLLKNYNNGQIFHPKRGSPSFVNLFKKNGFSTAAFVSLGVLASRFGLDQGFDSYAEEFPERRWYLTAGEVNQKVFAWLDAHKGQKFFLWIHYSDPHDPYAPPNTPDDTTVFFNNRLVGQFCLNKYLVEDIEVELKRGKNEIRFEVDNLHAASPNTYQARLDRLEFTPPNNQKDLQIEFVKDQWYIRKEEAVYFFKKEGTLIILNLAGPRKFKMTFRGKLVCPPEVTKNNYKSEVVYMDNEIGRLWEKLRSLDLLENSAILAVGDHGEGLGEYLTGGLTFGDRHFGHIHFLYNIYMKIPLLLYHPLERRKGEAREEPVTLLDIGPTIADIMGFPILPHSQGKSLLRLKKGEQREIFEETYRPEAVWDKFGLLSFPWHVVFTPEDRFYEIFNLVDDPREEQNLAQEPSLPRAALDLKQKLNTLAREALKNKVEIKIDKKTEEMLRALGYVK